MNEQQQAHSGIHPSNNSEVQVAAVTQILKVLAGSDALVILSLARDGIEAHTRTYSNLSLTRKQYYTRLEQLKNAGLIEKRGRFYFQTTMGSFLDENCIKSVVHAVINKKQMHMIDVLKRAGNFSEEDLQLLKNVTFIAQRA